MPSDQDPGQGAAGGSGGPPKRPAKPLKPNQQTTNHFVALVLQGLGLRYFPTADVGGYSTLPTLIGYRKKDRKYTSLAMADRADARRLGATQNHWVSLELTHLTGLIAKRPACSFDCVPVDPEPLEALGYEAGDRLRVFISRWLIEALCGDVKDLQLDRLEKLVRWAAQHRSLPLPAAVAGSLKVDVRFAAMLKLDGGPLLGLMPSDLRMAALPQLVSPQEG